MGRHKSPAPAGTEQQLRVQVAPFVLHKSARWWNRQPNGGSAVCQALPALRLSAPERCLIQTLAENIKSELCDDVQSAVLIQGNINLLRQNVNFHLNPGKSKNKVP